MRLEKPREFNFSEIENKIEVQKIGSLEEIYQELNQEQEEKINIPENAQKIIDLFQNYRKTFEKNGKEINPTLYKSVGIKRAPHILIAGGFVRDILMKKVPKDIDLATNLESPEVLELLKNNLGNIKRVDTQGETFQVVRVVFENNEEYEIATFRKDGEYKDGRRPESVEPVLNPGEDALRRDLTINAMFYNPLSGKIIDYVGGLKDIKDQKLRFVGDPEERINEDKSRMLRYVRFLLRTGFTPNENDQKAIQKHASEIKQVFSELIKQELDKALKSSDLGNFLENLNKLDLLKEVLPAVKELENCEQGYPYHQEGNVLEHTILLGKKLGSNVDLELKWAGIFHDIAKPESKQIKKVDEQEKVSFLKHEELGAIKTKQVLKKMKFSNKEIQNISWYIKNHMFFLAKIGGRLRDSKNKEKAINKSKADIKKLIEEKGEKMVKNLLKLSRADDQASIFYPGFSKIDYSEIIKIFKATQESLNQEKEKGIDLVKIINGRLIMKELGIKKGSSKVGQIKSEIIALARERNFQTKEDVEEFVQAELKKMEI